MKNLTTIFKLLLFPFLFLFSTNLNAGNECTGTINSTVSSSNLQYVNENLIYWHGGNDWNRKKYYITVAAPGTVVVSIENIKYQGVTGDSRFNASIDSCPGYNNAGTSWTYHFNSADDFNIDVTPWVENSKDQQYKLTVTFTPDAIPTPIVTPATFSVNEDANNDDTVGTVQTTDGVPTSFTIVSGNGDGIFQISNTGVITIADNTNLDYETTTSYSLSVRADNATGNGTAGTITININDVDETGGGGTEPSECPTGANEAFRDFCLRKKITLPGNMVTIGNTILVAPTTQNDTVCDTYKNGAYTSDATSANDSYYLCQYWDDVARPSTSATIDNSNIPDPANSTLEWAGLYWQALVDDSANVTGMKIKIKNGTDNYVEVGYDKLDWGDGVGHAGEISYSAFKDVTDILNTNSWLDGKYTVADIPVKEGKIDNLGTYGAWTLVLVYRNDSEKLRNFTIFDGWQRLQASSTNEAIINVSGFYTPKQTPISSAVSVFTAEGDKHISGDYLYATNANNGDAYEVLSHTTGHTFNSAIVPNDFARTPDPVNNQGIDIQTFQLGTDGEDFLETTQSSIDFKFTTSQDTYFPSMIAFNTELYAPELCYDYAYKQFGQYFTEDNNGSYSPTIIGEGLSTSEPVIVELFIRNDETSDATATNVVFHVTDINSSQATYMPNSAYVTHPNNIYADIATPNPLQEIDINDIAGNEYFSVDYNLSLVGSTINMPIKAWLEYTLILSDSSGNPIPLDFVTVLNENIPLCTSANFAYYPEYSIFNVENSVLSAGQKYNLPTQTANRVGDFKVTAYNEVPNENSRKNVTTIVSVELIDANKYHDIKASCVEPDSALTPRVWVTFENNSSTTDFDKTTIDAAIASGQVSDSIVNTGITPIAEAEDYFSFAKENTAFRISYNTFGETTPAQLEESPTCNNGQVAPCYIWKGKSFTDIAKLDVGNGPGVCAQDMANGQDTIPQWCGNNGTKGLDAPHLAECMECLYGVGIKYICSRDNFAIRPENFRITLNDQEQNGTNESFIAYNDDTTKSHSSNNGDRIVAGYNYAVEISATNHQNDNTTPGYYASFNEGGDGGMRTFQLKWSTFTGDTTYCNDTSDHNKSTTFHNGYTDLNLSNSQIGKYDLNLFDKLWTRVDWDSNYLSHHLTNTTYFISGSDCRDGDSIVPAQSSITTAYLDDMSGCDINTSSHTNSDNNLEYTDIPLYIFPYTFNHTGVIPAAGPYTRTNGQTFIYINTPDADDQNMSYNMNGTFSAVGFDNGRLSNFVYQCYADDVSMTLYLQYQHAQPTDSEPFLSYDLMDFNTTTYTRPAAVLGEPTYRFNPASTGPLSITQDDDYFEKAMNGSINMDLGYNFKRNYNETMNPRFIQMDDFNITYLSNPADVKADLESDFQIFGNKTLDQNITFLYGRAKPGKFFYEDIVETFVFTPVSTVAYCDLGFTVCQDRGIMAAFAKTNEADWWLSIDHRTADNDGDIILETGSPTEGSGSPTVTSTVTITTSDATDNTVQVVSNATELPMTVPINFVTDTSLASFTDDWLIYNEYDNNITSPFYKVRFIGDSNWTGIGDEGMVVGTEASKRKTKRLDW